MDKLPIQYHLEIYEKSFVNDPSYAVESTTPLPSIAVGDFLNHQTYDRWIDPPTTEREAFRVKEVEHIFWTIDKSHVGYKLMICIEVVPRKR